MLESAIQKKIIDYLHSKGAYTVKVIQANKNGVPDILCCLNGIFIGLEVKTEKGKPSALQLRNIKQIKKASGIAGVVRSVDDVKELLENDRN